MVPGVDYIILGFGHLLAFGIENQPEAQTALVADAVENRGTYRQQGVEPTSGLVDSLTDIVDWEVVLKVSLARKGVMPLGEECATAVEPAVHHERLSFHRLAVGVD